MEQHALEPLKTEGPNGNPNTQPLNGWMEARLRTRDEAAAFLKVSRQTVDRLRYGRRLAFYQIGGSVRFGLWDLQESLTGKPVFPESVFADANSVLTKADLGRFLGVSARTVEHLVATRGLWHRKLGRCARFLLGDVLVQLAQEFRVAARI